MGTPQYKWFSLSEMVADRMWPELRPHDKVEPVDRSKLRHVHGKFDSRPEYAIMSGLFSIPNTSNFVLDHFFSMQSTPCAPIERRAMNCLEAYGLPKSYEKCEYLVDDYAECITMGKQLRRVAEMRRERHRQSQNGEREFKYAPPPKVWSYEY